MRYADSLAWFSERPLFGERIGIFSPGGELGEALELAGVELIDSPNPITPAGRVVMGALPLTGWILKNADEADALDEERDMPTWGREVIAWCMSPESAQRARALGWPRVNELDPSVSVEEVVAAVISGR